MAEGGTIVYTASLTSAAQSPVTVTLSNGATIVIAAGSSSGSVNAAAPGEDVYADAGNVSPASTPRRVATSRRWRSIRRGHDVGHRHLDTTTVSLNASPSVAEGGVIVYTAAPTSAAQTPVSVTLSNGATIVIATGASNGSVNVPAPSDDVLIDAGSVGHDQQRYGRRFRRPMVNGAAATTTISDTIDATTVSLSATPSAEGGSIVYLPPSPRPHKLR